MRALLIAAVCLAGVVGTSCGSSGSAGESDPQPRIDLIVGDVLPLTGPSAGAGVSAQKAAQLAVEKVDDAIGDAGAEHDVEIVHADEGKAGAPRAVRSLIATGSTCIVGPSSASAIEEINGMSPRQRRAALIYSTFAATPHVGSFVVDLPPPALPQATLSRQPRGDHDPRAAFAALYESTDPPIGPAHASDARQFDAIVLCYLGAVAAKTTDPRLASSISAPRPGWPRYSWQTLDDAILALQQGQVIQYVGVSGRFGVGPPGVT